MAKTYAGVELGGTKCVAMLARGPDAIVTRETVPTTTPDETLAQLADILRTGSGRQPWGSPASGRSTLAQGRMAATPKPGWAGADILGLLSKAAGVPAAFDTDVNGAALAEMRWGSGQGMDDFAYITVGTGVGVGLIANGQPTRGFGHCELGHIRVARLAGDELCRLVPVSRRLRRRAGRGSVAQGPRRATRVSATRRRRSAVELGRLGAWRSCATSIVCAAAPRAIAIGGGVVGNQPHLLERIEAMLVDSLSGYVTSARRALSARARARRRRRAAGRDRAGYDGAGIAPISSRAPAVVSTCSSGLRAAGNRRARPGPVSSGMTQRLAVLESVARG